MEGLVKIRMVLNAGRRYGLPVASLVVALVLSVLTFAQTTISTGSIQGTVTDPSGAVVSGARISIRNKGTNQVTETTTTSAGTYASGALSPGQYTARIEAKGFRTVELPVIVEVNTTVAGNAKLTLGQSAEVIEVQGSTLAVNTEQSTVQGVITTQQIENLPLNGRNFLDLAQLEPGVQIQDAGTFGFGFKDGFSSISFGGRFGSSTMNIPASAIQEFQLSQSSLDLSTELTTSGAVNVITRSGGNSLHGEAFGFFRDSSFAAALPTATGTREPFQRSQFGGRVGGPIVRNKFFYFLDSERTLQ